MTKKVNRKALKKSFISSISRVVGVCLAAGAGTILHQLLGDNLGSYSVAFGMVSISFLLVWFAEYERESED